MFWSFLWIVRVNPHNPNDVTIMLSKRIICEVVHSYNVPVRPPSPPDWLTSEVDLKGVTFLLKGYKVLEQIIGFKHKSIFQRFFCNRIYLKTIFLYGQYKASILLLPVLAVSPQIFLSWCQVVVLMQTLFLPRSWLRTLSEAESLLLLWGLFGIFFPWILIQFLRYFPIFTRYTHNTVQTINCRCIHFEVLSR